MRETHPRIFMDDDEDEQINLFEDEEEKNNNNDDDNNNDNNNNNNNKINENNNNNNDKNKKNQFFKDLQLLGEEWRQINNIQQLSSSNCVADMAQLFDDDEKREKYADFGMFF